MFVTFLQALQVEQAGTRTRGELVHVGNSHNPWAYCMQNVHFRTKK